MNGQMEDAFDLTVVRYSDVVLAGVGQKMKPEAEIVADLIRQKFNETRHMSVRSKPHCAHCGSILMMHTTIGIVEAKMVDDETSYRISALYCYKPECHFVARTEAPRNAILWVGFE